MNIKKLIFRSCLLAICMTFSLKASAQSWTKLTSFDKTTSIIDISVGQNGTVYALSLDRWIYYSNDNGENWLPFVNVPAFYNTDDIEASKVSSRVFITTSSSGVRYTDNLGQNWSGDNIVNSGQGIGLGPQAIGLHDNHVLTLAFNVQAFSTQVFRSDANGNAGTYFNLGTAALPSASEIYYFETNQIFYTSPSGLFLSQNNGQTASTIANFSGMETSGVVKKNNGTLYVAANSGSNSGSIFISTDTGASWTDIGTFPSAHIESIAHDAVNDLFYVVTAQNVYQSADMVNWNVINTNDKSEIIEITEDQSILLGGRYHLQLEKASVLNPSNFQLKSIGGATGITEMEISGDDKLYTGSLFLPFLSEYDLSTFSWSSADIRNSLGLTHDNINLSVMDKNLDGDVFYGGFSYLGQVGPTINGMALVADSTNAPLHSNWDIVYPQTLNAGNDGSIIMSYENTIAYFSQDNGVSWDTLASIADLGPNYMNISGFCAGDQTYYLQTGTMSLDFHTLQSNDFGASWTEIPSLGNPSFLDEIFVDNFNQLYKKMGSGLYKWVDSTSTWQGLTLDLGIDPNIHFELAFDAENNMYALLYGTASNIAEQGVYFSNDEGMTWLDLGFPTFQGAEIVCENLSFDSNNIPFVNTTTSSEFIEARGGIYYYSESLLSVNKIEEELRVNVYPNPTSSILNVDISAKGSFKLYDCLGRLCFQEELEPGMNILQLPENLPENIYFANIETNEQSVSKKIIVVR